MHKLLSIAQTLFLERILAGSFPVSQKSKLGILLLMASGLLGAVALAFFIIAFYLWVQTQFTPELAALVTAGAILSLAIIMALTALNVLHKRRVHAMSVRENLQDTIQTVIASFDDELGDHVRKNPGVALALAGLAGYIIASRMD